MQTTTIVDLPYFGPSKILCEMKSSMMNVAQLGNFNRFSTDIHIPFSGSLSLSLNHNILIYINETIRKVHLNRLNS